MKVIKPSLKINMNIGRYYEMPHHPPEARCRICFMPHPRSVEDGMLYRYQESMLWTRNC